MDLKYEPYGNLLSLDKCLQGHHEFALVPLEGQNRHLDQVL